MTGRFAAHFQQVHDLVTASIGDEAYAARYPELHSLLNHDTMPPPLAVFEAVVAKIQRGRDGIDMHLLNAAKRDLHHVPHVQDNIYRGDGSTGDRRLMDIVGACFDKSFTQANALCHLSANFHYVYVSVPKAACTKIKRVLHEAERHRLLDGSYSRHDPFFSPLLEPIDDVDVLRTALESPDWFRFAFVRNPFARLLSCYLDKIVTPREQPGMFPRLGLAKDAALPSFGEFIALVAKQDDAARDDHWASQHYLLRPDLIDYDFIGKIENLPADLRFVCERLSIDLLEPPEKKEHRVGGVETTAGYYDDALRRQVADIYAKDFAAFGYDPETLP